MLLKNLFFNFYLLINNVSFYLILILIFSVLYFIFTSFRVKLVLFIFITVLFSIWGFLHNLDGMMLILLTAEFTIFLFFLMTYTQLYSNFSFLDSSSWNITFISLLVIYPLTYQTVQISTVSINYYQSLYHTVSSDFFIIYYLLFDVIPIVTILLTLIIGLFSLFFIILYFNLKLIKQNNSVKLKQIFFLRKQVLIKQTNYKSSIYTFQN